MEQKQLIDLLNDMSLEEKAGQLFQVTGDWFDGTKELEQTGPEAEETAKIRKNYGHLAGSVLGVYGAASIKKIQKAYMERQPHHIPLLFMLDIINGFKTIYPIPLALGAMFDPELAGDCAAMAAKEGAAGGLHVTFSPMVDLVRDPRWGRVMESTGEDGYLNSLYAKALVEGYQRQQGGMDSLAACVKHFAGYGAPEGGREYQTMELSDETFREFYLPAYESAVKAGSRMVMTAFQTVKGIPATVNRSLLRGILRGEMEFDGVLISDYSAIGETVVHGVSEDRADAAGRALEAGVDIDMMSGVYPEYLAGLVRSGRLDEALLDESVLRVLELKNWLGLFEDPFHGADEAKESGTYLCEDHRKLAYEAAVKSFVLLKNEDGVLPLSPERKTAFIGPYTESQEIMGSWSFTGGAGTEMVKTIRMAAEEALAGWPVTYHTGCPLLAPGTVLEGFDRYRPCSASGEEMACWKEEALKAAGEADVVVMPLGEHCFQSGEAASRAFLEIPEIQQDLFRAVCEVNSNVVAVVFSGRPLDLRFLSGHAKAVLFVWLPGMEGGPAIVDVLTGKRAPSGRLPMSMPYCVGQIPVHYDSLMTGRPYREGKPERYVSRYQDIPADPLFSFGYGLTYTEMELSGVRLSKTVLSPGETMEASVTLKNTGRREGTETVQLYLRDVTGSTARPVKQLKGWKHITLKPGEEAEVVFSISEEQLRFYQGPGNWDSEAGTFYVFIGTDSKTENAASFRLEK